jgi:hypothetical protein
LKLGLTTETGWTGDGLYASGSTVLIRGSFADQVLPGGYWTYLEAEGYSVDAKSSSLVVVSGVSLHFKYPFKLDGSSSVIQPLQPEPYLELTGGVQPGTVARLSLSGPAGQPALLLMSLTAGATSLASLDGTLWPATPALLIVPLVTTGAVPLMLSATLPSDPALESVTFWLQAAFPALPGSLHPQKVFLTNADALLIRL